MGEAEERRRERGERAQAQRAVHDARRERESGRAQALLDGFVAEAVRRGLPTTRLTARPWNGKGRYPTDVDGWYLRLDRSLGVGTDGGYRVLTVPPRRLGRWRTTSAVASPPPLLVGEGARDGEAVELDVLLRLRLQWPP